MWSICKETLKNIKSLKDKHCLICSRGWRTRPSRTVYCHQGVRLKVRTQRQTQCICIHRYCFTNRFQASAWAFYCVEMYKSNLPFHEPLGPLFVEDWSKFFSCWISGELCWFYLTFPVMKTKQLSIATEVTHIVFPNEHQTALYYVSLFLRHCKGCAGELHWIINLVIFAVAG